MYDNACFLEMGPIQNFISQVKYPKRFMMRLKQRDGIDDPAFVKLIKSIDDLIAQLKTYTRSCEIEICKLELAKQTLINDGTPSQMYRVLKDIQPIVAEENDASFSYHAFLAFTSLFQLQSNEIKYGNIVEEIRTDLGKLFPSPQ
jgi:hypothetical protein